MYLEAARSTARPPGRRGRCLVVPARVRHRARLPLTLRCGSIGHFPLARVEAFQHLLRVVQDAESNRRRSLENHVFRGTRIKRSNARGVLNGRCTIARYFQLCIAKQFHHRSSSPKVIGAASQNLTKISRSCCLKPHVASVQQHHGIVAHSILNDNVRVARNAVLVVGNNNADFCPFACLMQAFDSLTWVL
jgi:hypothetical protein